MATRSMIGKVGEGGRGVAIYCHGDGYPDVVGRILNAHYRDEEQVDALMALRSIRWLDEDVGSIEAHDDAPPDGFPFEGGAGGFFGRDLGGADGGGVGLLLDRAHGLARGAGGRARAVLPPRGRRAGRVVRRGRRAEDVRPVRGLR